MVNCNYNEVTAIFTANFEVKYMYIKDRYAILRHICLFVFLFWEGFRPTWEFFLIKRRHHFRWRTANFDLCSGLMAIEHWGFFSVPNLLGFEHPNLRESSNRLRNRRSYSVYECKCYFTGTRWHPCSSATGNSAQKSWMEDFGRLYTFNRGFWKSANTKSSQ